MTSGNLRSLLVGAVAAIGLIATTCVASATEFKMGEVDAVVDTTVSIGTGIRTSGISCTKIALNNGGCSASGSGTGTNQFGAGGTGYGRNVNFDDGNINSRQWNPFTTTANVTSELQLTWQNYGAFFRAKGYYDYWGAHQQGTRSAGYGTRPLDDAARGNGVTDNNNGAGHGIKLLDAFAYGNFNVGDQTLNVRLGNQVVNWGESLILQGGINSFQPIDLSALRTPGAQLKEAYVPNPMIYAQLTLPANFGVEAFYEFGWNRTRLDACGTFFSFTDGFCEGGMYLMNGVEYGHPSPLGGPSQSTPGVFIPRIASEYASNSGQWGVKGSYYADWLNDGTDLGVYFTNYHTSLPIATFTSQGFISSAASCAIAANAIIGPITAAPGTAGLCNGPLLGAALLIGAGAGPGLRTLAQYPEDIHMLGMSFNTTLADFLNGTALSGELAYSPNMPFQVADTTLNANSLANAVTDQVIDWINDPVNAGASIDDAVAAAAGFTPTTWLTNGRPLTAPGGVNPGYDRHHVLTGQIYTISTLPTSNPVAEFLGANIMPLIANVGFQYVNGANRNLAVPMSPSYNDNALADFMLASGRCPGGPATTINNVTSVSCPGAQFATPFSWGYRLIAIAQYDNAFNTAWSIAPAIQWAHDVGGYSAGPTGPGFVAGKKTVSLGVTATLRNQWSVSANWTSSFGNEFQNTNYDKDFAQFNVSYAF